MEIIDFHTHFVPSKHFTPHMTDFFQDANADFIDKASEFDDPHVTVELFRNEGVKYAVVLGEESPATTYSVSPEELLAYCRGHDMLLP